MKKGKNTISSIRLILDKWFVYGKLNCFARPVYDLFIDLELVTQKVLGCLRHDNRTDACDGLDSLTAIVKTFQRPKAVKRLVKSIKARYPDLHIIVVDDSHVPLDLDGVQMVTMPYDSGVSAGRNEALRHVRTKFFLLLDDDFVFYHHTRLESALALMERFVDIDIMGGQVVNLPFFTTCDYRFKRLYPTGGDEKASAGGLVGGLPVYDIVANFFIGQTERVRSVGWDPQLKRLDHSDFFTRANGVLTTVYNSELKCLHAQTPFDFAYMVKRTDYSLDRAVLRRKYFPEEAIGEVVIRMAYEHSAIPHFLAECQGEVGAFDISGNIIEEKITSPVALRLIKEWAYLRHKEIVDSWNMAAEGRSPERVPE